MKTARHDHATGEFFEQLWLVLLVQANVCIWLSVFFQLLGYAPIWRN